MGKHLLLVGVLAVLLHVPVAAADDPLLTRYYTHKSIGVGFCTDIILRGSLLQIAKFKYWLNEIAAYSSGRAILDEIAGSGHTLTIEHAEYARISAGRTQAPMTQDLINGRGADVRILFDGTVTDRGSHLVYNARQELVEYTAAENLFHELAHAKHKMKGTWRYFDSEEQAIEEENVFRAEVAVRQHLPATERAWITGIPIESVVSVEELVDHFYPIRSNPPNRAAAL